MAVYLSPGVYVREIDLSLYIPNLSTTALAMVGICTKGPLQEPKYISDPVQFAMTFGDPNPNYMMPYAALQFLRNGRQLWVVRVAQDDPDYDVGTATFFSSQYMAKYAYTSFVEYSEVATVTGTTVKPVIFTDLNNQLSFVVDGVLPGFTVEFTVPGNVDSQTYSIPKVAALLNTDATFATYLIASISSTGGLTIRRLKGGYEHSFNLATNLASAASVLGFPAAFIAGGAVTGSGSITENGYIVGSDADYEITPAATDVVSISFQKGANPLVDLTVPIGSNNPGGAAGDLADVVALINDAIDDYNIANPNDPLNATASFFYPLSEDDPGPQVQVTLDDDPTGTDVWDHIELNTVTVESGTVTSYTKAADAVLTLDSAGALVEGDFITITGAGPATQTGVVNSYTKAATAVLTLDTTTGMAEGDTIVIANAAPATQVGTVTSYVKHATDTVMTLSSIGGIAEDDEITISGATASAGVTSINGTFTITNVSGSDITVSLDTSGDGTYDAGSGAYTSESLGAISINGSYEILHLDGLEVTIDEDTTLDGAYEADSADFSCESAGDISINGTFEILHLVGNLATISANTVGDGTYEADSGDFANAYTAGNTLVFGAAPVVKEDSSIALSALDIRATTQGSWGNNLEIRINNVAYNVDAPEESTFDLTVWEKGYLVERYLELSKVEEVIDPYGSGQMVANPKYVLNAINDVSPRIVVDIPTGQELVAPVSASTTNELAGGTDGVDFSEVPDPSLYIGTVNGFTKTGLQFFMNPEEIDINLVCVPGISDAAVINAEIELCQTRADCMAIIDSPIGYTPQEVVNWRNGTGQDHQAFNSSYAALYWPWLQIYDPVNKVKVWTPPCGHVASAYAYTDYTTESWFAPAGLNRGHLVAPLQAEYNPTLGERDLLYLNSVNPIATFIRDGIVVWGQKTLQTAPTALDRVNVRRLLLYLEKVIATASRSLLFEPNDPITWKRFIDLVSPFLDGVRSRRGLVEYQVRCDSTTNTPDRLDRNEMVGIIFIKPTKAVEFLQIDFVITSQGANFDELVY